MRQDGRRRVIFRLAECTGYVGCIACYTISNNVQWIRSLYETAITKVVSVTLEPHGLKEVASTAKANGNA